jgi:hypothetical protein
VFCMLAIGGGGVGSLVMSECFDLVAIYRMWCTQPHTQLCHSLVATDMQLLPNTCYLLVHHAFSGYCCYFMSESICLVYFMIYFVHIMVTCYQLHITHRVSPHTHSNMITHVTQLQIYQQIALRHCGSQVVVLCILQLWL